MLSRILHRRSVRQYTDQPVSASDLQAILCAGLAAPTSKNRRPWEFVVVRDRSMLDRLCHCRPGAERLLAHCSAAIVVAGDSCLADVWVEDCAAAMTQMHLMADALGVGSCWLQIRLRKAPDGVTDSQDVIRQFLRIPEHLSVLSILVLGMPESHPGTHTVEELPMHKIHHEHF